MDDEDNGFCHERCGEVLRRRTAESCHDIFDDSKCHCLFSDDGASAQMFCSYECRDAGRPLRPAPTSSRAPGSS